MAKPVLGRGLGNLLKDTKSDPSTENPRAGEDPAKAAHPGDPETARLSPGMASLLRKPNAEGDSQANEAAKPNADEPQPPSADRTDRASPQWLRVSLVFTDLLLLGMAAHLVLRTPGRLGFVEVSLCVIAIVLGAWLTCVALWRR